MGLADIAAEIEADYRAQVIGETFGHLAPKKNHTYRGDLVIGHSLYGDVVILKDTLGVDDSPWYYQELHDFAAVIAAKPGLYRWEGTFRNYVFKGQVKSLML